MSEPTMGPMHPAHPRSSELRPRLLAAAAFLLVLVVGAMGGIALDRLALRPGTDQSMLQPRDLIEEELVRELQLTPSQREHLDSLLTHAQTQVRAVSREAGPRFRAIVTETLTGLRAILTPEQWDRLQAMRQERRAIRRERLEDLRRRGFDIPDSAGFREAAPPAP